MIGILKKNSSIVKKERAASDSRFSLVRVCSLFGGVTVNKQPPAVVVAESPTVRRWGYPQGRTSVAAPPPRCRYAHQANYQEKSTSKPLQVARRVAEVGLDLLALVEDRAVRIRAEHVLVQGALAALALRPELVEGPLVLDALVDPFK